ncbi:unnamed protein product [Musa hybrid cultivar]
MAFHNHLSHELTLPQYAEEQLGGDSPTVLMTTVGQLAASTSGAATEAKDGKDIPRLMAEGSGPTWLNSAILRRQGHRYADGSFLHLQTTVDSSSPPVAAGGGGGGLGHWFPRPPTLRRSGSEDEAPVSSDSVMVAAIPADPRCARGRSGGEFVEAEALAQRTGGEAAAGEGTWQSARYKAEILAHPLCEQLLSAHVACVRIATPVDQLPRIDAQLAQSQQVVSKYSVLGGGGSSGQILGDGKELDQFMVKQSKKNPIFRSFSQSKWFLHFESGFSWIQEPFFPCTHYVLLLCSFKEQLQQHVRVHAMEAVMACWELEQALQSLTGVSPGEGTGATMSDDDDDDQVDSETNLLDGSLDGPDSMGFGPLVPTDSERSLMERVRQELKHELKQGYKEKIVDVREEILRKRRAGKLPGDSTCTLKAWWQSHSKWPYPTEDDKAQLVEETGLQLKQINNWFINQRKRNWHTNPSSSSSLKSKRKRCFPSVLPLCRNVSKLVFFHGLNLFPTLEKQPPNPNTTPTFCKTCCKERKKKTTTMAYGYTPTYYSSFQDTITSLCKSILPFSLRSRRPPLPDQKLAERHSDSLKWQQESFHRILHLMGLRKEGIVPESDVVAFRTHILDTLIAAPKDQEPAGVIRDKLLFLQELYYAKCISAEEYHSSKRPLLQRLAVQGVELDCRDVIVRCPTMSTEEESSGTKRPLRSRRRRRTKLRSKPSSAMQLHGQVKGKRTALARR